MPEHVRDVFGYGIYLAQSCGKHPDARPLRGYDGTTVLEIIEDYHTDTYRAVYTVRFAEAVFVLHAFKKEVAPGYCYSKAGH